jgi:hypothetical protein
MNSVGNMLLLLLLQTPKVLLHVSDKTSAVECTAPASTDPDVVKIQEFVVTSARRNYGGVGSPRQ